MGQALGLQNDTNYKNMHKKTGIILAALGIIFGVVSIFFLPIVFGIIAVILGGAAINEGAKVPGVITIILAIIFSLTGFLMSQFIPPMI